MRLLKIILALVLFVALPAMLVRAATTTTAEQDAHALVAGAEHAAGVAAKDVEHDLAQAKHEMHGGLPPAAPIAFQIGWFQVTSSMVITWSVAALLILVAQLATRKVQLVPTGLQNFLEWLIEGMYEFFGEILGKHLVKKTFWFFCTIFIFILVTNWVGLIPGVGSIGWGTPEADGSLHHISQPILRGGNADLNMTLAMALTFFALWTIWSFQALGVGGFFKHLFSGGDNGKGFMAVFITVVFLFVGFIEVISIAFRPVSLSFRLYGNIFAGENILEAMMLLGGKWLGPILPLPFYFLELLVGLVQALVFALLTAVFTALMCGHHEEGHGEGQAAASDKDAPAH